MDIMILVAISNGIVAVVVGLSVVVIAHRQKEINQQRLEHEIFDKRMRLYKVAVELLFLVTRDLENINKIEDLKIRYDDIVGYAISLSEVSFLFGSDVSGYVNDLLERTLELWQLKRDYIREESDGDERDEILRKMRKGFQEVQEAADNINKKFEKYLSTKGMRDPLDWRFYKQ